jgi:DNA-binding MarR family transcriptional regulator
VQQDHKRRALTEELGTLGSMLRVPFEAMLAHNWARVRDLGYDDIRVTHGAVFRNIAAGGSRVTDLAHRARMTKQSMAELVTYLQKRGYVEVSRDPNDRRGKLVRLTERGTAVFNVLADASNGFEADCARLVGRAKWERFRTLLAEVAGAVALLRDEDATA